MSEANSNAWKPAISVWRWEDAPEEFRQLSPQGGEAVIYLPKELLSEDGDYDSDSMGLSFLNFFPKTAGASSYAGDDWGWYAMFTLPDGGRVAIAFDSVRLGASQLPASLRECDSEE